MPISNIPTMQFYLAMRSVQLEIETISRFYHITNSPIYEYSVNKKIFYTEFMPIPKIPTIQFCLAMLQDVECEETRNSSFSNSPIPPINEFSLYKNINKQNLCQSLIYQLYNFVFLCYRTWNAKCAIKKFVKGIYLHMSRLTPSSKARTYKLEDFYSSNIIRNIQILFN